MEIVKCIKCGRSLDGSYCYIIYPPQIKIVKAYQPSVDIEFLCESCNNELFGNNNKQNRPLPDPDLRDPFPKPHSSKLVDKLTKSIFVTMLKRFRL